jgi:hypothetical protein
MVSFGFRNRVAVAVSANAGTYAMPDLATPWPLGLGETDVDIDALRALLGFRITMIAGTADVSTTGRFFQKGPRSMRQGATRYVQSGHAAAAAPQTSCTWAVIDVPGMGHDGKLMSGAATPIVPAAMHAARREQARRSCDYIMGTVGFERARRVDRLATQESGHEQIQQGAHREADQGVRSTLPNRTEILMRRWPDPIWTSGRP